MTFWDTIDYKSSKKVLVIPNITNSSFIEKDSFVDVIYNHIKGLESLGDYYWNIVLPQPVKKLNLPNVKQHILPFSGDMIKMRTYPPDMNKLLETLEYDVIYSHLPDWPQVGRLGVSQMETCFLNTQEQKDRVLEEARIWFNDQFVSKLDKILYVWNLGIEENKIIQNPLQSKEKIVVFNHRAAAYKGYPKFIELMKEYRERRQDFKVWVPQLDGKPEYSWIDNTKVAKHDYYKRLQQCTVGVQMRQTNYGWSVAATDCMMNGTPMIFQESDCYKEIDPNGLFFKFKKDLFQTLDNLLDNDTFRTEQEVRSLNRARELSLNDKTMFKILNEKLNGI